MFLHAANLSHGRIRCQNAPMALESAPAFAELCVVSSMQLESNENTEPMAKRFDLIVFDWDGTLMDSTGAIVE
jgi:hypothetical protein